MLPKPAPTTSKDNIISVLKPIPSEAELSKVPNMTLEVVVLPVKKAPKAPAIGAKTGNNFDWNESEIKDITEAKPELF